MILVVGSEKGGTGKTTISTNLAVMLAQNSGGGVLLVDSDPQGSAMEFNNVRDEEGHTPSMTCVKVTGKSVASEVRKLSPKFDHVVIDVGGRDTAALRSAMVIADVLIVPFLPSQYDAWSIEHMDGLIEDAQGFNPDLTPLLVMNKVDTNPQIKLAEEAREFVKDLKNLQLVDSRLANRVAFRRSAAEGQTVNELAKKDPKAAGELQGVYDEVMKNA